MENWIEALPTISRIASGAVLVWIGVGLWLRHRPKAHIPIMLIAFVLDLTILVVVELNRGAVATTLDTVSRGGEWILKSHIAASVIFLLCYVAAIILGTLLLKRGGERLRVAHKRNAVLFLAARVWNFATSFFI